MKRCIIPAQRKSNLALKEHKRGNSLPATQWDRTCTSGGRRAQSSHPCHFLHRFYTAGMWNPSRNTIHIVPGGKKNRCNSLWNRMCLISHSYKKSTPTFTRKKIIKPKHQTSQLKQTLTKVTLQFYVLKTSVSNASGKFWEKINLKLSKKRPETFYYCTSRST